MTNPFEHCAQDYDAHRPAYPGPLYEAFLQRAAPTPRDLIADCGAGTGKASLPLRAAGYRVLCIEPSLAMARQGRSSVPGTDYVCADAERLPVGERVFHSMIAGQCFHWFDPERALPEIARTLQNDGHLAVFWNNRDSTASPAASFFESLVQRFNSAHVCAYRDKDYGAILEQTGDFAVTAREEFGFTAPMTVDSWVGLARSISYVREIGDEKLNLFESALREELETYDTVDCHYRTEVWFARKRR